MTTDKRSRARTLEILKDLLESPFQYTKADWVRRFNCSKSTIKEDITELRNVGFEVAIDRLYRHGIIPNKVSENLKKTLYFTESEFQTLKEQLDNADLSVNQKTLLTNKLENIFDLTRIGGAIYNNVFLQKLNVLIQAEKDKQKVRLKNYSSANTNTVSDRILEAFRIIPKDDTIYAYEPASGEVKHYKISRFDGIEQLDDDWENEGKHYPTTPDVFGYVSKKMTKIYIKLDIAGYNRLVDRFPHTKAFCQVCPTDSAIMELECEANEQFDGISQFLIGQHQNVIAVKEPQELIDKLNSTARKIEF
jgi:predicted DNA-binding transcriptional regulator YafY